MLLNTQALTVLLYICIFVHVFLKWTIRRAHQSHAIFNFSKKLYVTHNNESGISIKCLFIWDKIIQIYQVFWVVSRKTCSKTGILRFSFLNLHVCVFLWLTKACLCSFMFIPDTLIIESSFQINQVVEQQFCWLWTLNIMAENRISRWYERFSLFSSWSLKQMCTNLKLSTHTICFSKIYVVFVCYMKWCILILSFAGLGW